MTTLNTLHQRVFDLLKAACEAGAVSPTLADMVRTLGLPDDPRGNKVKHAVDVIARAGLLKRESHAGKRPIYQIPGTKHRTISSEEGFAKTCGSVLSAERATILYNFISLRCRRNGFTPSYIELTKRISAGSESGRTANVSHLLAKLERQGLIAREGKQHERIYRLPGTSFCTRPLPLGENARHNPFSTAGWPRPTKTSATAYDAAVDAREFARHNRPAWQDDARRHVAAPREQVRSLTGCSAEMCAV